MRAIVADSPGGPEVLRIAEVPDPVPGPGEVLLRVAATAVNRADTLQRMGLYPPPPGASEIIGLECSGSVLALGDGVEAWAPGDEACALLGGGGYAELVAVPAGQLLHVPPGISLPEAAGIPEAFLTAHDNLFTRARLGPGESVLIHGGGGGVGTAAIQLAHRAGCRVIVTAGTPERIGRCLDLGADAGIDHHSEDFVERTRELTGGDGVDVILDVMGAAYLERNLRALATDGRLVVIGLQGGVRAEVDLNLMMRTRATVISTTLRARPAAQKAEIVAAGAREVMPGFADGSLRVVVDRVFDLADAAQAHRLMEAGGAFGKIVLRVGA
jgi:putative PIG3 family NAD(P)H quinone oxidoreductase